MGSTWGNAIKISIFGDHILFGIVAGIAVSILTLLIVRLVRIHTQENAIKRVVAE